MSRGEQFLVDLELTEQISHTHDVEQPIESKNELAEIDEPVIPEGEQYSLMSKRLKVSRIQQIAEVLSLPTGGSNTETRQAIKEKLLKMEYEPVNVQVIIQGRGDDASMFLVNDNDIIEKIECGKVACRVNDETGSKSNSCSALRDS